MIMDSKEDPMHQSREKWIDKLSDVVGFQFPQIARDYLHGYLARQDAIKQDLRSAIANLASAMKAEDEL